MPTLKTFDQLLIFVNLHHYAKNQFILSVHFPDTVNFRVLSPDWPHPFLTIITPPPKISYHLSICVNLCLHAKNQIISSVDSWDTFKFRVQRPDWPHPFFTMPNKKKLTKFWFLWICIKMQRIRLFHRFVSEEMVDLKILQSDWLRLFWSMSQEQDFFQ